LREALARGVDRVILLSGREFAGSDTWATSYALACAVRKLEQQPQLILFGKQAIDGDTAQVGPGVSEFLDLPLITFASSLKVKGDAFCAETLMDEGVCVIESRFPAVVTVAKGSSSPRFASLNGWMQASSADIPLWDSADIGADPAMTGLDGSPTRVKEIFAPPTRKGGQRIDARDNSEEAVNAILEALKLV
jgi:electron transfer flavoprotein beta subunit